MIPNKFNFPTVEDEFHWALLGADGPFDLDHILAVTRSVGLDAERPVRDMEDPALDPLIERNAILAIALGVGGTPAFVILYRDTKKVHHIRMLSYVVKVLLCGDRFLT